MSLVLTTGPPRCPVCQQATLQPGERVDVGIGAEQVTPDTCDICGYIQPSAYGADAPDIDYFIKCWELQVDPWGQSAAAATTASAADTTPAGTEQRRLDKINASEERNGI